MRFMELFMNDEVDVEDLADYIAQWHDADTDEEVHEYLGMTLDEYLFVAVNEDNLYQVRAERLNK